MNKSNSENYDFYLNYSIQITSPFFRFSKILLTFFIKGFKVVKRLSLATKTIIIKSICFRFCCNVKF